jgi:hypothetical protein
MDYAQDTKYPTTLAVAKQKDIIVNAVPAGSAQDTARIWRDIAQLGNGRFIPIPQDGGQVVETPYDDDIIILQREINGTVIPYGPGAPRKHTEDKTRSAATSTPMPPARPVIRRKKPPRVVPANARIHNHSCILSRWLVAHLRATWTSVVMGPGARGACHRAALCADPLAWPGRQLSFC